MSGGGLGNAGWVAVIAIVPLVVLMLTSFVKVSVVLSLLRNAIGATDAPSGLVVMGVSIILTFFVMAPVAVQMVQAAAETPARTMPAPRPTPTPTPMPMPMPTPTPTPTPTPMPTPTPTTAAPNPAPRADAPVDLDAAVRKLVPAQYHGDLDAIARGLGPLRAFLGRHASPRDRATFVDLAARMGDRGSGDELWVLAPAFLTTELREAFAIAVLIFLPFLVIDLVVALGLAALGLPSTSPQVVSLPLKLLLLVSVDGWRLLIDSLLRGYV